MPPVAPRRVALVTVRLTIIGCSGSFPGPDSPASCYLMEADGFRLLLDLGNGALGPLQRHTGLYDIDAVCLSHLHADHCLDLTAYWVARTYAPDGAPPRIPVLGPAGTAQRGEQSGPVVGVAGHTYPALASGRPRSSGGRNGQSPAQAVGVAWGGAAARKTRQLFSGDYWPYGVEPNRVTLEAFLQYSFEQGVSLRRLKVEEIFARETLSVFRV